MAGIRKFVERASAELGLEPAVASSATGGLLGYLRHHVPAPDFRDLVRVLPGAEELAAGSEPEPVPAGLTAGGRVGAVVGLVSTLKGAGLDVGKVAGFSSLFLAFTRDHLDAKLLDRILAAAPDWKAAAE
ncbi:MAG: hypothetical protein R3B81_08595 [bacterium]